VSVLVRLASSRWHWQKASAASPSSVVPKVWCLDTDVWRRGGFGRIAKASSTPLRSFVDCDHRGVSFRVRWACEDSPHRARASEGTRLEEVAITPSPMPVRPPCHAAAMIIIRGEKSLLKKVTNYVVQSIVNRAERSGRRPG